MKTCLDFKNILQTANPKGVVIVADSDGKNGGFVPNPATLNITTYGYKNSDGVDITEGKKDGDFIGLPYYTPAGFDTRPKDDVTLTYNNATIEQVVAELRLSRSRSSINLNKDFIKMLSKYSDDSLLVSFDGSLINDVKLNGDLNIYLLDDWGNRHYISPIKPNDVVVLIKGEKLNSFFREGKVSPKLEEEIKRSKKLMK